MTTQKRGRGRPPKTSTMDTELTVLLLKEIEKGSGLKAAELEQQLLPAGDGQQQPGSRWNRYARGDRPLNQVHLERLYKAAVLHGYLEHRTSGFRSSEFSYLSLGKTTEEVKTTVLIARAKDRALTKQVADARSLLRKLRSTLDQLGEGYWDNLEIDDESNWYRQAKTLEQVDALDQTLSKIRFDSLYFDRHMKESE